MTAPHREFDLVAELVRSLRANRSLRWAIAIVAGALLVSLGAQAAVWLPGTPVPFTLQVP
ncbi:MAG: hypothetical protein HY560_14675, partial [Gemmatimonadetes bacterium]|nr:hypothetical protein [Gemmatimonadota bacterium]